jgi:hypothetical protein
LSHVVHQVHEKFKSFVGTDISTISKQISAFVESAGGAAKSIGIVHVSSANELLFSLGYRDDEPSYAVELQSVNLGHVDALHGSGLDALDKALESAAGKFSGIICHELVVTASGDFVVVFLTHKG